LSVIAESYSVEAYLKAVGVDEFAKAFAKAQKEVGGVDNSTKKANVSISSLVKTIAGVAAAVGVFRVLRSAVGRAFDRIDTMEQFDRVMVTMTGSADEAARVLDEVNDAVTGTSYGLDVGARAVQDFVTSSMDVDKATETMASWGDAVAFYGDNSDETFRTVTEAISRMVSRGSVQMEEMNRLTEAGVPAMQIYADATGQSVEEVSEEMRKGAIDAGDFVDIMNDAMQNGTENFGAIEGAAKEAGASWAGSFANMQAATARGIISIVDSIDQLLTDNGLPDMRGMIAEFGSFMETTLEGASKFIEPLGNALFGLIGYMRPLTPVLVGLTSAFLAFQTAIAISSMVTRLSGAMFFLMNPIFSLQYAFLALNKVIMANPFAWLAALIVGVTAGIIYLWKTNETFRDIVVNAWESVKTAIAGIEPILSTVGAFFSDLGTDIAEFTSALATGAINAFNSALDWLGDAAQRVSGFISNLRESIDIREVLGAVVGPLTTVATLFLGLASPIGWLIKGFALLSTQTSIFSDLMSVFAGDMSFGEFANNFATEIANLITTMAESATEMITRGAEMVTGFLEGISQRLPEITQTGVEMISNFVEGLATSIGEIAPVAVTIITTFVETIVSVIPLVATIGVQILTTLIETIVSNFPMLVETYMQIVTSLIDTVVMMIPLIVETVVQLLVTIIETIVTMLPMMIETYMMIVQTLIDTIVTMLPLIIETVLTLVMLIASTLIENLPLLMEAGMQILNALIEGIITILPVLIESILMIINSLLEVIVGNLPLIIDAGIQILMALIEGIVSILPVLLSSGMDLLLALVQTLIGMLPQLMNAGIQILMALIQGIISIVPQLLSAGVQLIIQLVAAIIGMIPQLLSAGKDLIFALIDGALSLAGSLLSAGKELVTSIISGIISMFSNLLSTGGDLASSALSGVTSKIGDFLNAGKNIVGSIADGIRGAVGKVTSAISGVASKIRDFLPFSPAKEGALRDIMKIQIPQSIAESIEKGENEAIRAMAGLANAINGEMPQVDIAGEVASSSARINTSVDHEVNRNDSNLENILRQALNREQVIVMDTGALVGQTADRYNQTFGNNAQNSERWGEA
jgi:tape measure domain-containing protein